jgi:very-short-patch-repair endonuclease
MRKINNLKPQKEIRKKLRNSATPQEIILWSRLKRKQLGYKFRRQQSFGKYIVDFYCPLKNLVIELDGWQHKEQMEIANHHALVFQLSLKNHFLHSFYMLL